MKDDRTKVDALYDLAVKLNGTATKEETVVNMIDNITENYESGGSGGGGITNIVLQGQIEWLVSGEYVEITDEYNLGQLMAYKDIIANGGSARIGFKLDATQYDDPTYYVLQTKIDYLQSIPSAVGDTLKVEGIGFLNVVGMPNTFVKVEINYGWVLHSTTERMWNIKLTPLTQS